MSESKCPVTGGSHKRTAGGAMSNKDWWPHQLNLKVLNQNSPLIDPILLQARSRLIGARFTTLDREGAAMLAGAFALGRATRK